MTSSSGVSVNSNNISNNSASSSNNNGVLLNHHHHHQSDATSVVASFQPQPVVTGTTTGFRSPNVVAPGSQPIPFLQQQQQQRITGAVAGGVATAASTGGAGVTGIQTYPNGSNGNTFAAPPMGRPAQPVYPFASMTHAAQSVLGQAASSSPCSSTPGPPNQAVAAIRARPPVSTITNPVAGVPVVVGSFPPPPPPAPVAIATPPPPAPLSPALSPSSAFASCAATPSQLLPSALHPATVKSTPAAPAAPIVATVDWTASTVVAASSPSTQPMQQPSVGGGSRSPHFQHSAPSGGSTVVTTTPSPPTPQTIGPVRPTPPPPAAINVQQTVPVTTAASSPLLVNLLQQQQQQQQQQQMARNSSPITVTTPSVTGQTVNQVPYVSAAPVGVTTTTTTSPVTVAIDPTATISESMDKVRQQGAVGSRAGSGRSLSINSPLSSSPSSSPYHQSSSPNSPAPASLTTTASVETNLTLAASVTVLNVRTGAPLNATALSSLATPSPATSAPPAVQNTTTASPAVAMDTGEIVQVNQNLNICPLENEKLKLVASQVDGPARLAAPLIVQQPQQPTAPRSSATAGIRMPIMTRAPGPRHPTASSGAVAPPGIIPTTNRMPASSVNSIPPPPYPGLRPSLQHVVNHSRLPVIPGGATVTAVPATIAGKIALFLIRHRLKFLTLKNLFFPLFQLPYRLLRLLVRLV